MNSAVNSCATCLNPGHRAAWRKQHHLLLEIMLAVTVIMLTIGMLFDKISLFAEKTRLLTVATDPFFDARMKVMEYHAVSGDWPGATVPDRELALKVTYATDQNPHPYYTRSVTVGPGGYIQQGAIHIEIQGRRKNNPTAPAEWWSMRPAVMADDAPTVFWMCGSHPPPAGFHASGENLTTLPPDENFRFCR
jgi:hypothetical protein